MFREYWQDAGEPLHHPDSTALATQVETHIQQRIGRAIRDLAVLVTHDPLRIILRGDASTYYHKQMAQEAVKSVMKPCGSDFALENHINVA